MKRQHVWKPGEDAILIRLSADGHPLKDIIKGFNEETKLDLSRSSIQHRLSRLKSGQVKSKSKTSSGSSQNDDPSMDVDDNDTMDVDDNDTMDVESIVKAATSSTSGLGKRIQWTPELDKLLKGYIDKADSTMAGARAFLEATKLPLTPDGVCAHLRNLNKPKVEAKQQPHRWKVEEEQLLVKRVEEAGSVAAARDAFNAELGLNFSLVALKRKHRLLTSEDARIKKKEYGDLYNKTPKARAARKRYWKKWTATPHGKAWMREWTKKRRSTPEYKAWKRAYMKEYRSSERFKVYRRGYEKRPKHKARRRLYMRLHMALPHVKAKYQCYLDSPEGQAMLRGKALRAQAKQRKMRAQQGAKHRAAMRKQRAEARKKKKREAGRRATLAFCQQ